MSIPIDLTINLEIILTVITSLVGAYIWKYKNIKIKLQESHYRYRHTLLLQKSSFEKKYKSTLHSLIRWIEDIYNPSSWVLNYSRHITIALVYSSIVFIFFWMLGASGTLGSIEILNDGVALQTKIITLLFFIFYIFLFYYLFKYINRWSNFIIKKLPKTLQRSQFFTIFIIVFIVILVVVGIGGGIVVGGGIDGIEGAVRGVRRVVGGGVVKVVIGIGVVVGVGLVVVGVGVGVVGKLTLKSKLQTFFALFLSWLIFFSFFTELGASIFISLILTLFSLPALFIIKKIGLGLNLILWGSLFLALSSQAIDIATLGLFFLILPLLNALLDYISLKVSIFMANKILRDVSLVKALFHLLIDTIIAIFFLYILAIFLYGSINFLNGFLTAPIPIKEMLLSAKSDPFSIENGWITFMLISTLVPTFVHFIIALGALLVEIIPSQRALRDLTLYETKQESALLDSTSHYFTRIFFAEIILGFGIVGLIILILWYV